MTPQLVIRGLPRSLARDAWWFGGDHPEPPAVGRPGAPVSQPRRLPPIFVLALLVALADVLFWQTRPGMSLVLFAWALFAAAALAVPRTRPLRPAILLVLSSLPALEYVQTLSLAVLALGLAGSVAWLHMPRRSSPRAVATVSGRILRSIPTSAVRDLAHGIRRIRVPARDTSLVGVARAWALPVGGAMILTSLLAAANPVLDEWLSSAFSFRPDWIPALRRLLFWSGLAIVIWPFLLVPRTDVTETAATQVRTGWAWLGLNPASALRALITFNILVGVQTFLDALVLLGGGGLPEGVTYSEYARQGSYPLLAITLLGGAFALGTRPFLAEHRLLRPLLYLWLFQNVLISAGALQRLVLYVDAYGLTYLRLHTMIWIPLVATGLALTAWQVHRALPNAWLVTRAGLLSTAVVYAACFVNFAEVIARHNLGADADIDWSYLTHVLPDTALPTVLRDAEALGCPEVICKAAEAGYRGISDWREWDFRRFRADLSLQDRARPEGEP
jgi:hypothetical protein